MDRQSFKALEQAIRQEKAQPLIRQTYSPATIVRQVADKDFCSDLLNIKQRVLLSGVKLANWYKTVAYLNE